MKAIRIHAYGGPEQVLFEDAPEPRVGDDDVLVQVHASGVNPVDWKVREGYLKDSLRHRLPLVVGWDVSGVVIGRGHDVTRFGVGDKVYGRPDIARDGSHAERIAVRAHELTKKPRTLDHVGAAAVPLAGLTAWQALFDAPHGYRGAGLRAGDTVLIHAAAGGVGTFAVQLARWKGARVIGTCSARNLAYVRALGATETVDYTKTRFEDAVRDVDAVIDCVGGETQERSFRVLRKGGILVSIVTPPAADLAAKHEVRTGYVFVQPSALQLDELATLIDAGTLRVEVTSTLPLASAREAQALSRTGHTRGKIVLRVRDENAPPL